MKTKSNMNHYARPENADWKTDPRFARPENADPLPSWCLGEEPSWLDGEPIPRTRAQEVAEAGFLWDKREAEREAKAEADAAAPSPHATLRQKPKTSTIGEKYNRSDAMLVHEMKRLRNEVGQLREVRLRRNLRHDAVVYKISREVVRLRYEIARMCKQRDLFECPSCGHVINLVIVDELNQVLPKSNDSREPELTPAEGEGSAPVPQADVQVVASLKL